MRDSGFLPEVRKALLRCNRRTRLGWEKAMAPHSSTLAWKIPWMEKPGGLQSMGSLRVGHDWVTSLSLFTFINWRRKWQPTPVFLPGESQGPGEPAGLPSMGSHRVGHNWSDLAAADLGEELPLFVLVFLVCPQRGAGPGYPASSVLGCAQHFPLKGGRVLGQWK